MDIVSNAAMGFPPNHPAMWHAVAMVEESFFERRYVGDQAGPGLLARIVSQYDDVALYPPAYFHPTVGESKLNPDAEHFLLGAHLFRGDVGGRTTIAPPGTLEGQQTNSGSLLR